MENPAFWRDLQSQFRALPDSPGARLSASEGDGSWILSGGPTDRVDRQSLQNQFRALARRGGIATGVVAVADQAFDAWLNLLRQRSPRFLAVKHESCQDVLTDPRDLPVAEIDSPTPMDSVSEADQDRMIVVDPGTHGRYVLVVGHGAYSAAVANGLQSVLGRIRESTQSVQRESGWIDDLCLASAELCIELETEAFSEHHVRPLDSAEASTGQAIRMAGLESELLATDVRTGKGSSTGNDKREYVFRQAADHLWEVRFADERQIGVKNLAGMTLIRTLLAEAGRPMAAWQLMADSRIAMGFGTAVDERSVADAVHEGALGKRALSLETPTLDGRAMREIRARLEDLGEMRKSAQDAGDQAAEARIDEETGAIEEQLRKDRGLGGRLRPIAPEIDKPRRAAFQRYRTTLKYLKQHVPALADHLERCIRSGATFVYQPDSEITWLT